MKTAYFAFAIIVLLFTGLIRSDARDVTLTINTADGGAKSFDEVSIGTNETAEIVTWLTGNDYQRLKIVKDGIEFERSYDTARGQPNPYTAPQVIAGPAVIRLLATGGAGNPARSFCTIRINPGTFPPDKTLIIPADTRGANIILEASSDLIQWTNAPPGLYTNLTGHMFFRIRAERIP